MSVKYEPISIKNGRYVLKVTLDKIMHEVSTSPEICARMHYLAKFEVTN